MSILSFQNITKSFGNVFACEDVTFDVQAGSIHALVGENGAGKSTTMKILFGLQPADQGKILWQGHPVKFRSSRDAIAAGIGMVHQHFMLAENLSALDNIILQKRDKRGALQLINHKKEQALIAELASHYGMELPLLRPIKDLSVGEQQRVEILKSLLHSPKLLILDEPTAVLTPQEIQAFFVQLKKLKASGTTIIIITHKLKEVMALADQVTVLRKGRTVFNADVKSTSIEELAVAMTGHQVQTSSRGDSAINRSRRQMDGQGRKNLVEIKNLSAELGEQKITKLNLELFPGEIVGVAGVEGNGQDLLLRALLDPRDLIRIDGEISILDRIIFGKVSWSAQRIRELGIRALPEDRLRWGVVPEMSLQENWLLTHSFFRPIQKFGFLQKQKIAILTDKIVEDFKVSPAQSQLPICNFSGGNQQKFVVGREISDRPQVLVAAHPTRGVDIGAIFEIHQSLLQLSETGSAILLVSSELDEILALSDRIFVLHQGQWTGQFQRKNGIFDERQIGLAMVGKGIE